jgi:hypothetical protein
MIAPTAVIHPSCREIPIRHHGFMPSKGEIVVEDDVWVGRRPS